MIDIGPVVAFAGTVAVTNVFEYTLMPVDGTPLNLSQYVCVRSVPEICTTVPTAPLVGENGPICGGFDLEFVTIPSPGASASAFFVTMNRLLLLSTPAGVVTVTTPLVAPVGTVAVRYVAATTVKVAAAPLKDTLVVP